MDSLHNVIDSALKFLGPVWSALGRGLSIFVEEILPGFIAVYFVAATWAYIEHEVIRELIPGVRYTRLGRIIEGFGLSVRYVLTRFFGWSSRTPNLIEQWAGLYTTESHQLKGSVRGYVIIQQAIQEEAEAIRDSFTGKRSAYRRINYQGEIGSGTHQIAQYVYSILEPEHEIFYFDCSAFTRAELHKRFLSNLAAWADAAEIVALPSSRTQTNWQIQDVINIRKIRSFLKHYTNRSKNRPIIIILDVERLFDSAEGSPYVRTQNILRQLFSYKHSRMLVTSNYFTNIEEGLQLRFGSIKKVISQISRPFSPASGVESSSITYVGIKKLFIKAFIKNYYSELDNETLLSDLNESIKIDEFEVLILLLEKLPKEEQIAHLREFIAWNPKAVSERLFSLAIEIIKQKESAQTGSETAETIHEEKPAGQNEKIRTLVSVIALFDAPVPLTSIIRLWTECNLNFAPTFSSLEALPPLHEPGILTMLVEFGLVQRLFRLGPLFKLPLYAIKPTFKPIGIEHTRNVELPENDIRLFDYASECVKAILSDLRPPGITPVSTYISQGDFRATSGLSGYTQNHTGVEELIIPLPSEVCQIISATQRGQILPECQLKKYFWEDRGGKKHADLVAVISPTEFSIANNVCRVGVHIVSREGTGRAVQRALDPYVDKFLDAEGDAYRFGPGGYIELLVRLKSVETILDNQIIGNKILRKMGPHKSKNDVLLSDLIEFIEDEVQNVLRSGIDDQATVQLILGTDANVADDWMRHTEPLPAGFELASTTASVYGTASRYSLIARDSALGAIRDYLKSQNTISDINCLRLECVYSYTTLQAFFILKAPDLRRQVRAEVLSTTEAAQDHVTLSFMRAAEQLNLNLSSLKHGPYGSYIVDFELPATPYGMEQESYNALIIKELREELNKQNVKFAFISSLSTIMERRKSEGVADMGTYEISFAADGPMLPAAKFDYVADPEIFHRYMRKHLFIPDSDAAILAIAQNFLSELKKTDYRVLEIGSGTGALTEKLIQCGIKNLDSIEPDDKLSGYWENLKKDSHINQDGIHYCKGLEDFANGMEQKYDLIISQGVHHHIPAIIKYSNSTIDNNYRLTFLNICRSLLNPNGIYVISDEFLVDYDSEDARLANLDRWYGRVISTASADGFFELADLEHGFWLNDRTKTVEYKESIEKFISRLTDAGAKAPFEIKSITRFGMTKEYGGGFGVIVLKVKEADAIDDGGR
jgi:SAM-dependent methyltransferase